MFAYIMGINTTTHKSTAGDTCYPTSDSCWRDFVEFGKSNNFDKVFVSTHSQCGFVEHHSYWEVNPVTGVRKRISKADIPAWAREKHSEYFGGVD